MPNKSLEPIHERPWPFHKLLSSKVGLENHQSYNIPKTSKNSCCLNHIWYTLYMVANFRLQVVFYNSDSGKEPARDWLKKLDKEDRKVIGEDIKTV